MTTKVHVLAFAGICCAFDGVSAQEKKDTAAVVLDAMTIRGAEATISTLRVPLAVTVLGPEQLKFSRGYGLDEALSRVPGVLAQSRYGNQDVRITIRGFGARGAGDRSNAGTSRGIRVLIDGIPETEPDGRTSFDGVDLSTAQRIDVIRSNASSLWGNAAGGLVNISTLPQFEEGTFDAGVESGSYDLRRWTLRGARKLGTAKVFGAVNQTSFGGWRESSSSRRSLLNAGLFTGVGAATQVGVYAYGTNNLFHIPGPLSRAQADTAPDMANPTYLSRRERRFNRLGRLGVTVAHQVAEGQKVSGMAFVNPKYLQRSERGTFRDFTRYHTGGNLQYTAAGQVNSRVRSVFSIGADEAYQDGAILFYGLSASNNRGSDLRDNKREGANNVGVFVQEQLDLGTLTTLTLGARYDNIHYIFRSFITPKLNDQKNFSRVTPKIGLVYRATPSHSVYANIGGGVEAPAGNETDPAGTFGQDTISGINPLLEPIRSTTYEVGTKYVSGSLGWITSFSYDLAAYQTDVTNEIVPYRGGRFYFTAAKARRRGLEAAVGAVGAHGIAMDAALTVSDNKYQNYHVDSVHYSSALAGHLADYSGNNVVGVPSLYGSANLRVAPPALRGAGFRVGVLGIGKYYADDANRVAVPGYAIVNLALTYGPAVRIDRSVGARVLIGVNNIFDRAYIGSAFLNPDVVGGVPLAFEPGLPRNVVVSVSLERLR